MPQPPWSHISQQISTATGEPFEARQPQALGGGCINSTYFLQDGKRRFFVKTNDARHAAMFAAEAVGLRVLSDSGAIRIPLPICHGADASHAWLVLEYISLGSGKAGSATRLGEQLATLHRVTANRFGFDIDNTIGATPQINTWDADWVSFFGERRLRHQFELAAHNGLRLQDEAEQLISALPMFFTDYRPMPALLHGDLWGGNWGSDETGAPVIFDPASYYGDRETDLAMTELFGGFPSAFYAAYRANYAIDPGYDVRKILYNLYHILNHFNLFGGGYDVQARRMVRQLHAEIA